MVKSSSKKDRHSKINTARGPRDRRMRLSLDVAKKFFRLQDILGFDKASNTIDWLLVNSKPAIQALLINPQQLIDGSRSNIASSAYNSEGEEVVSGIIINVDQSAAVSTEDQQVILINKAKFSNKDKLKKIDSTTGGVIRKSVCMNQHQYDHSLAIAKETRAKARARARKRTSEKKINNIKLTAAAGSCTVVGTDQCYNSKLIIRPIMSTLDQQVTNLDQKLNPIGSWIPLGSENNCQAATDDQAAAAGSNYFQFKQAAGININVGDIDSSCSVMSSSNSWSPSFLFNYQHNPAAAAGPSHDQHDHQFSEFQMISKPWE